MRDVAVIWGSLCPPMSRMGSTAVIWGSLCSSLSRMGSTAVIWGSLCSSLSRMGSTAVIWGFLCLIGAGALRGPSEVTIPYGEPLSVTCQYDSGYESYVKYWCKGESWKHCEVIIKSSDTSTNQQRYSIKDNPSSLSFTITGRLMRPEDSDTYYCGIEKSFNDYMHSMRVTVLPGVCRKTQLWDSIVTFPPGFMTIEENKKVEVSCKEPYESRTFHLTCEKKSDIFQFYPLPDPAPCTRKCERMMNWGQNISMYPEKEYYGQDEDVTLICPEGYQPNYGKIRCIRDNGTNSWNVTEVFCIYSPRKCERMMNWGQNISLYPEKEYYGQDEEVTLTCPTRYQPNYSRIRCIRDNGTNIWNVTEVFCIYSPTVPPTIPTSTPSWRNIGASFCLGVIGPMGVKLIVVLVILAIRVSAFVKRRSSSVEDNPDMKMTESSHQPTANLYKEKEDQKTTADTEEDPEMIYENVEVDPSCNVYTSTC